VVYFRFYPVQIRQGFLFGLSQPQANDWLHRLTPILNAGLRLPSTRTVHRFSICTLIFTR
jgi:hypothetical protein